MLQNLEKAVQNSSPTVVVVDLVVAVLAEEDHAEDHEEEDMEVPLT